MNDKRKGKYGYVEFVDKRKLRYDGYDDNIEPEFRKPTPAEREEIILNFIRAHSGKSIRVWWLAEKLGVSDRTIQKILKKFEEEGLISRTPLFTDTGKQRGNILTYLGAQTPIKKTDLTLKRLYDPDNPCGFRDWNWEDYKFIPGYYDKNFTIQDAKELRGLISGAYKDRVILAKYYSFLLTKKRLANNITNFPIIVDSPRGDEQDKENAKIIMDFILRESTLSNQLIVATIDGADYLEDEMNVNVIELTNERHSLLNANDYNENEKEIVTMLLNLSE